jgi:multidrug resistance efflux pump
MSDAQRRRIPGLGVIIAVVFLFVPLAAVGWWLNRPQGEPTAPGPGLADLDVVCLGRVDGLVPVAALEPAVAGKVSTVVAEGAHVKAGEELLTLDTEAFQLRVEEALAAVRAADLEVKAARQEQELFPLRKKTQEAAWNAALSRADAARKLYQEKVKSAEFVTVTAAELAAADADVRQLEQLAEAEKARLDEMAKTDPSLRVQAAEVKQTTADIARRQAEKAVRDCTLLAPTSGTVLRVQTSVGEMVMPGSPQAPPIIFRPDGPLVVRAELEQEFLGRVRPQMKAIIQDDARADSPTWTGTVLRVGNWVARKRNLLLEPGEMNDVRTVECVIAFDGTPEGLLVGQRMRVRIGRSGE